MSKTSTIALAPGADIGYILKAAEQQLQAQGYEASSMVMGPGSGSLTVRKDRDGIKNLAGMGVECQATVTAINPGTLTVNVESEWTNKILALALGWILCWVPFVTGIIGCVSQSELPNKLIAALQSAAAGGMNNPQQPYQQNYQAPQYQQPYQQPQEQQYQQQPYQQPQDQQYPPQY